MNKGDENGRNSTGYRAGGLQCYNGTPAHSAIAFDDLWAGRMGDVRSYRTKALHSRWFCNSGLYPVSLEGKKA